MSTATKIAAIIGAGPGNGAAFAKKFLKENYKVGILSRNLDSMVKLASELGGNNSANDIRGYACDVTSNDSVKSALMAIQQDFGAPIQTVIYNAGSGGFKDWSEWTSDEITQACDINASGLFRVSMAALDQLKSHTTSNIVVVGAGAATRGRPSTVGFAAGKAAQRSVAQSLARAWGAEFKIHVCYMIIDGVIDTPMARQWFTDKPKEFFLQSDDIAEAIYNVTQQKQSAWTFEFDVRPFGETW